MTFRCLTVSAFQTYFTNGERIINSAVSHVINLSALRIHLFHHVQLFNYENAMAFIKLYLVIFVHVQQIPLLLFIPATFAKQYCCQICVGLRELFLHEIMSD